jgi:O-antigen/teichoic acid export membrane protein
VIPITQVLSLSFLLNGLMSQYRASLLRHLRFRALAIIDVLAGATALAVAITLALLGFGFWALVGQQLVQVGFGLIGTAVAARWLPGLPNREGDIRPMVKFGWALVGSQLIAYASANIDTLLVGIRFGTVSLGFYNRAFQLVMTPVNQIRGPMTTVALPVLSRIQDTRERYHEYVVVGQLGLSYPICLALGAVAVFAEPVTLVALGPQWGQTAPILRLLAISAMFQTLAFVGYWVYVSRGLGRELFKYSMLSAAIRIACIVIGSQWGVVGVAFGFMIGPAINWPISIGWLSRVTDVPTRRLYLGAGRVLLLVAASGGISAAALALLPTMAAPLTLVVGFAIYLAVIGLALLVPWYRRDALTLVGLAKIVRAPRAEAPAVLPPTDIT